MDIAYAPFIERFHPFLLDVKKYDITLGRPKLATWIEVLLDIALFLLWRCNFYKLQDIPETFCFGIPVRVGNMIF